MNASILPSSFWIVVPVLFVISVLYNQQIDKLERRGRMQAFTWLSVVIGVGYTLIGVVFLIGWAATLLVLIAFIASGVPMIWGDIRRFWVEVENGDRTIKNLVKKHKLGLSSLQGADDGQKEA